MTFTNRGDLKIKKEQADLIAGESANFSPEKNPLPEAQKESDMQKAGGELFPASEQQEKNPPASNQSTAANADTIASASKSAIYQKIENILEEDLGDLYLKMDAAHQRIFKEEGEKTVRQIEHILESGKAVISRITELIKRWLRFIPGVNKFFIEQEAKIKADKILNSIKPHNYEE